MYYFYLLLLFLLAFFYGFFVHRNKIFPFKIIKALKDFVLNKKSKNYLDKNKKTEIDLKENQIKNKYKNWKEFHPNFKTIISAKKYLPGMPIYSNKSWFNHCNDEKLKGLTIIQIPRHHNTSINLNTFEDIMVYRVLTERNDNKEYDNWEKMEYNLAVIGVTCVHTNVVRKKFKKGIIKILPGGPVAADPIFVGSIALNEPKFEII